MDVMDTLREESEALRVQMKQEGKTEVVDGIAVPPPSRAGHEEQ